MFVDGSRGSSSAVVASVLVLVAVLGLVGWRLYENQRVQDQANNVKNTTNTISSKQSKIQASADPNKGYVVIKEWGVRFKPAEGSAGVIYFRSASTPSGYDRFDLSTQELGNREAGCKSNGFSSITRTTTQQATYESLLAKIGDYYYYYRGSDAACSSTVTNATFEAQQRSLVKESIKTLEVAR